MAITVEYGNPPVGAAYGAGLAEGQRENARIDIARQAAQADLMRALTANSAAQQHSIDQGDDRMQHALIAGAQIGAQYDLHAMDQQAQIARDYRLNDMELGRDRQRFQMAREHDERTFEQQRQMEMLRTGTPLTFGEQQRLQRLNADMDRINEEEGRSLTTQEANRLRMQMSPELNHLQSRVQAAQQRQLREQADLRRADYATRTEQRPVLAPDGSQIGTIETVRDNNGIPHLTPGQPPMLWTDPVSGQRLMHNGVRWEPMQREQQISGQEITNLHTRLSNEAHAAARAARNPDGTTSLTPANNWGLPDWASEETVNAARALAQSLQPGWFRGPDDPNVIASRRAMNASLQRDMQGQLTGLVNFAGAIDRGRHPGGNFAAQNLVNDQSGMAPGGQPGAAPPAPRQRVNINPEDRQVQSTIPVDEARRMQIILEANDSAPGFAGGFRGPHREIGKDNAARLTQMRQILEGAIREHRPLNMGELQDYNDRQAAIEASHPGVGRIFDIMNPTPEQTAYNATPQRVQGLAEDMRNVYNNSNWFTRGYGGNRITGILHDIIQGAANEGRALRPQETANYMRIWRELERTDPQLANRFRLHNNR